MDHYIKKTFTHNLSKYLIFILFLSFNSFSTLHATTKIMPLGDSITWDWYYWDNRTDAERSGYRNYLWYLLQNDGYEVDFVGSRVNGGVVTPLFDGDNDGYTGYTSHQIADMVYNLLTINTPDIILLHIGTNDWPSTSVYGVERILNEIDRFEQNHNITIKVVLAQIIKLPARDITWAGKFNDNLYDMAKNRIDEGDDIILIDMENGAGINYSTDLVDGIHPNNTGYSKMANVWFNAIKETLDNPDNAWLIPLYNLILN
jgi:acyl-CoA thioesterase-1